MSEPTIDQIALNSRRVVAERMSYDAALVAPAAANILNEVGQHPQLSALAAVTRETWGAAIDATGPNKGPSLTQLMASEPVNEGPAPVRNAKPMPAQSFILKPSGPNN